MRVNVYTEELTIDIKVVMAEYVSSRTGKPMTNYGVRIFLKSHPDLHFKPNDDDRSAVTLWVGSDAYRAQQLCNAIGGHLDAVVGGRDVHHRNAE